MDREHRVRQRADFTHVQQSGQKLRHPLMRVQWHSNALPLTRFGFVVSKRVAGAAHERNLVRRRLRELARAALPDVRTGVDVVVIAQTAARTATFQELRLALAQLLLRAQLQRQQDEHA